MNAFFDNLRVVLPTVQIVRWTVNAGFAKCGRPLTVVLTSHTPQARIHTFVSGTCASPRDMYISFWDICNAFGRIFIFHWHICIYVWDAFSSSSRTTSNLNKLAGTQVNVKHNCGLADGWHIGVGAQSKQKRLESRSGTERLYFLTSALLGVLYWTFS